MSTGGESNAKTNEKPVQRKANTSFVANRRAFGCPDYPYFRDWIISWLSTVAIRTSEEDPVHHFRLIRPDLKIWNAPSHPICILRRFQCSPLPPLSTAPNPGVASFHRPCSMQITIFPCYSFGYEKYMPFLHQNNLLLPPRTCFPAFSTPSSTHLCNFQFLVVGVTT